MAIWSINDISLTTLRVTGLVIRFNNQSADEAEITTDADYYTALHATLADGTTVIIKRDGVRVFVGYMFPGAYKVIAPDSETARIVVKGSWWILENIPTLLSNNYITFGTYNIPAGASALSSRRVLSGSLSSIISSTITASPWWIALGTVDLDPLNYPEETVRDMAPAEIIRKVLAWSPGATVGFDYSTTPLPTMFVLKRGSTHELSYTVVPGEEPSSQAEWQKLPELVMRGVRIVYERRVQHYYDTDQSGRKEKTSFVLVGQDQYPADANYSSILAQVYTIELSGSETLYEQWLYWSNYLLTDEVIETSNLGGDKSRVVKFWQRHGYPGLTGFTTSGTPTFTMTEVTSEAPNPPAIGSPGLASLYRDFCRTSTNKQYSLWPELKSDKASMNTAKFKVTQVITGALISGASFSGTFECTLEAGNSNRTLLADGLIKVCKRVSDSAAEQPPSSSAATLLYGSMSRQQYKGRVVLMSDEPVQMNLRTQRVVLVGAGETITPVNQVQLDVLGCKTELSVSPPDHLGVQDYIALARLVRRRK